MMYPENMDTYMWVKVSISTVRKAGPFTIRILNTTKTKQYGRCQISLLIIDNTFG